MASQELLGFGLETISQGESKNFKAVEGKKKSDSSEKGEKRHMWMRRVVPLGHIEALKQSFRWRCLASSYSDTACKKSKSVPLQERQMVDRCKLYVKAGDGGGGCNSIRRSRHDRRGRPDGGNGGRGGDVILECSTTIWDLSSVQHHVNGKRGGNGASKNNIGSRGADKVVQVPLGTVIHLVKGEVPSVVDRRSISDLDPWEIPGTLDFDGSKPDKQSISNDDEDMGEAGEMDNNEAVESASTQQVNQTSLSDSSKREDVEIGSGSDSTEDECEEEQIQYNVAELTEPGQQILVARGGEGGLGNTSFTRKPKRTKDSVHKDSSSDDEEEPVHRVGTHGSEAVLILELKTIADVGLVGMPNAGKSTLLGAISKAKPVVGYYAFTTLRPNLGNLNYEDLSIKVADIPGLMKGAHEDRGLGHAFLRHIERTKVLAYVVDLAAALDGRKGIPPWEQLRDLMWELERHQEGLSDRPSLIVANKIDEDGAEGVYQELKRRVQGVPIYPVCAVLEEGVVELKAGLKTLVHGDVPSAGRIVIN